MTEDDPGELASVTLLPTATARNRERNADAEELEALAVTKAPWSPGTCRHRNSIVDPDARTLRCKRCGVDLDPIEVLDDVARFLAEDVLTRQLLTKQIEKLRGELTELQRLERNAKSRLAAARRRALGLDIEAVLAAARSAEGIGGYRRWEDLSEPQREVVAQRTSRVIEAYCGALEERVA